MPYYDCWKIPDYSRTIPEVHRSSQSANVFKPFQICQSPTFPWTNTQIPDPRSTRNTFQGSSPAGEDGCNVFLRSRDFGNLSGCLRSRTYIDYIDYV